jgi:hypothetical protein
MIAAVKVSGSSRRTFLIPALVVLVSHLPGASSAFAYTAPTEKPAELEGTAGAELPKLLSAGQEVGCSCSRRKARSLPRRLRSRNSARSLSAIMDPTAIQPGRQRSTAVFAPNLGFAIGRSLPAAFRDLAAFGATSPSGCVLVEDRSPP